MHKQPGESKAVVVDQVTDDPLTLGADQLKRRVLCARN